MDLGRIIRENELKHLPGYILYNLTHPLKQVFGLYCSTINDFGCITGSYSYPESAEHMSFLDYRIMKKRELRN